MEAPNEWFGIGNIVGLFSKLVNVVGIIMMACQKLQATGADVIPNELTSYV